MPATQFPRKFYGCNLVPEKKTCDGNKVPEKVHQTGRWAYERLFLGFFFSVPIIAILITAAIRPSSYPQQEELNSGGGSDDQQLESGARLTKLFKSVKNGQGSIPWMKNSLH